MYTVQGLLKINIVKYLYMQLIKAFETSVNFKVKVQKEMFSQLAWKGLQQEMHIIWKSYLFPLTVYNWG